MKTNKTTRTITTVLGILLAFAGFEHGLFASLQGNQPTESLGIQTIGKDMQWWAYGGEDAITLVPNFLLTGILAMLVSIVIVIWSLKFLQRRNTIHIFLLLFILLVLVGGGMGFIPFFLLTWAYGTRINSSLSWWRKRMSEKTIGRLSKHWTWLLTLTALFWLAAIEIAIFGWVPGVSDPDSLLAICWSFLLIALILINFTYICGFANDLNNRNAF